MSFLFKKTTSSILIEWPDIPLRLKVFYPCDWWQKPLIASVPSLKFHAQKDIQNDTVMYMFVGCEKHDKPFEDVTSITTCDSLKESTKNMGAYLCSQYIEIGELKGAWVLHKTSKSDGILGYRTTYLLYYWKYNYSIVYGVLSDNEETALSLYKEHDELFYNLAIQTKFKWKKGS